LGDDAEKRSARALNLTEVRAARLGLEKIREGHRGRWFTHQAHASTAALVFLLRG